MSPGLVSGLLSHAVAATEIRGRADDPDGVDESWLWPEERPAIARVVAGRRRDYIYGRRCARQAMEALGEPPAAVLTGDKREPLWPAGLVGAITHTVIQAPTGVAAEPQAYAAAAVARQAEVAGLGIDAEPNAPLPGRVAGRIARPEELERIDATSDRAGAHLDRLLFCAKEATYKVWYPLTGRWLGYLDATVALDVDRAAFEVDILVDGPIGHLAGRFGFDDDVLVAAIELAAIDVSG